MLQYMTIVIHGVSIYKRLVLLMAQKKHRV